MAKEWKVIFIFLFAFLNEIHPFDLSNLGDYIQDQVNQGLEPVRGIGRQIEEEVNTGLLPVKALAIRQQMMNGIGGITIALYGEDKKLLIRNGVKYKCDGAISTPKCEGMNKTRLKFKDRTDFCYANSFAHVNDDICLSGSSFSIHFKNGNLTCTGNSIIQLNEEEFNEMCGFTTPEYVLYIYYPDSTHKDAIAVPNPNPYVNCMPINGGCGFRGTLSNTLINTQNVNVVYDTN